MPTIALHFEGISDDYGVLMAELADWGCEAFEEASEGLIAYLDAAAWKALDGNPESFISLTSVVPRVETIPDRNWNEEWERSIQPMQVGPFCVRPSWSDCDGGGIPLIIDPKMSFGTGYHESTRLVLRALEEFFEQGMRVLDAGTGTGILAIAALKLGARSALGFDVDLHSYDNAIENAALNDVSDRLTVILGDIVDVEETGFDIVLANINRETLRAMMPELMAKLNDGGLIAFSGILIRDRPIMVEAFQMTGLEPVKELEEGDWWSVWCRSAKSVSVRLPGGDMAGE